MLLRGDETTCWTRISLAGPLQSSSPVPARSDAEGVNLNAKGVNLNAEGVNLNAEGVNLNAEGVNLNAEGVNLNAEGVNLNAEGVNLNAEGVNLNAEGVNLNAEGVNLVHEHQVHGTKMRIVVLLNFTRKLVTRAFWTKEGDRWTRETNFLEFRMFLVGPLNSSSPIAVRGCKSFSLPIH